MNVLNRYTEKVWLNIIAIISVAVVLVVAFLIYNAQTVTYVNKQIYILPKLNAFLNGSVAVLLTAGFLFIRQKNMKAHRACMLTAFTFSSLFLVSYIIYHANAIETIFGDLNHNQILDASEKLSAGATRYVYYVLLITHIILAAVILPMAMLSLFRIWNMQTAMHRKIGRWTFPLWLYVSVTGVIIYLMISPYYPI